MIKVSESAAQQIQTLIKNEKRESKDFLRVEVKRGGCSGFSYKLDFDNALKDGDKEFQSEGVTVVVDSKSLLYIMGMTLNFEGGLNGSGFTFVNPNASKTCGCGSSFAV